MHNGWPPPSRSTLDPKSSEDSSAPGRGFMSSGAAQLPRQRGGTCRHRGAVIGCRAPQTLQPERGLAAQPAAAAIVAVEDVRTPATPFVALSAVRTSVRLVERTSGVQATGVIQVSGQTGVRTDRRPDRRASGVRGLCVRAVRTALDPGGRCRGTAQVWRTGFDVSLWSASGLVVAARIRPGWEEMVERWQCVAGTRVDGRPGPPPRMRTGCGAALAAWPTKGAGPAPGCRSVGWGAREGAGAHESPAGMPLGRLPACCSTMGGTGRW
jgi:hypothetical protein